MLVFLPLFLFCQPPKQDQILAVKADSTAYYKAKCDSLTCLAVTYEKYLISYEINTQGLGKVIARLNDSISVLNNRPVMSVNQFLELYRYERLLKYYKICKNKPTQWKFYKGWSIRVFEE